MADGPAPVGDAVYVVGLGALGFLSLLELGYNAISSSGSSTTVDGVSSASVSAFQRAVEQANANDNSGKIETKSISGTTPATPPDPNGSNNNRNWKKVNDSYLKKQLQKQDTNPHDLKYDYLGRRAQISLFDVYVDTTTGQLGIFSKSGDLIMITEYFIGGR